MPELEPYIRNYFRGKGIETSRTRVLKDLETAEVIYKFKEPNNLYHFYEEEGIEYESFDFVFNQGLLTETKFLKILFKEWFYLLRVGGNLVIIFEDNESLISTEISEMFSNLVGEYGELLYIDKTENTVTLIVQKLRSVLNEDDTIDKWSFCIINQSDKNLNRTIDSIKSQKIPDYEIILERETAIEDENIRVLHLSNDMFPSTSMKKNHMLLSAKYENVVIMDNKQCELTLNSDWYKGAKRYGNYFECLSGPIITSDGQRYADWWSLGSAKGSVSEQFFKTSRLGLLAYKDWDEWAYFPDSLCILKKNLFQISMWHDFIDEGEGNIQMCHQLQSKGSIMRMNTDLVFEACNENYEQLASNFPRFIFDKSKLGKRKGKLLRRIVWAVAEVLLRMGDFTRTRKYALRTLKSTGLYKLIAKE